MTTMMRSSIAGLASVLLLACGGGSGSDDTADDGADDGDDTAGVCGDGTTNSGEECDDGNTDPGDGCDDACQAEAATSARMTSLALVDPPLYAFGSVPASDIANDAIAAGIGMDADDPPDGNLDLNFLLVFRPWTPDSSTAAVDAVAGADCAAPGGTACTANGDATVVEGIATNTDSDCLAPAAGTTSQTVDVPVGRCFATDKHTVTLNLSTLELELQETQIGGTYSASGHSVEHGLMVGFISEAAADATIIPEDVDFVGGMPLSSLLLDDDKDTGPGGVTGWWFYLNFAASEVTYAE